MTKKQYAFYPGCSSQKGASAANYITSFGVICDKLDIQLNEIPD
jgi:heterodisulfide reductase subunit B